MHWVRTVCRRRVGKEIVGRKACIIDVQTTGILNWIWRPRNRGRNRAGHYGGRELPEAASSAHRRMSTARNCFIAIAVEGSWN